MERRIAVLGAKADLTTSKIRLALAYARAHGVEILGRIARNRQAAESFRRDGVRVSAARVESSALEAPPSA
ncbi:hypothetical protein [Nocardia asiatica]